MWIPQENEDGQGKTCDQPQKKARKKAPNHRVGLSFPKALRLLSSAHFQKLHKEGKRVAGSTILIQYKKSFSRTRLGITVSKKYGKAHDRNRFKRVVREAFRECYHSIPEGLHVNICPRLPRTYPDKWSLLQELQELLKHVNAEHTQP